MIILRLYIVFWMRFVYGLNLLFVMLVSSLCFWNFCQGNCKWYTRMIWFNCMKLLQQPVFLIIRAPRTLHTAEVGTVRPLLGSFWNGHAMLCLFQILFMCCECTIDHSLMLVWWKSHNNFSCLCCRLLFWNFLWFPLFFPFERIRNFQQVVLQRFWNG